MKKVSASKKSAPSAVSSSAKKEKKLPPAPLVEKAKKVIKHPFFEKTPRNFSVGGNIQPKRDLTRFVKWPKYIRLQRQKSILLKRLKVPPALNQFNYALNKNQASQVLRLLSKYKPETRAEKKKRLTEVAKKQIELSEKKAGSSAPLTTKKPIILKYGLNHVTDLIEIKKAKLVVIAHDVDPIEVVCWLPTLCRKKDIPYCIIKSKSRLGQLVHQKNVSVVALDGVRKEDQGELEMLCRTMRSQFNDNVEMRKKWGGGIMGIKSQHVQRSKEKAIALEQAKKLGYAS